MVKPTTEQTDIGGVFPRERIKSTYKILVVNPLEREGLQHAHLRVDDYVKVGFKRTGLDAADWIRLAQDRDQ